MTTTRKFPTRMLSNPVDYEDRVKFEQACKDLGFTTGEVISSWIQLFPHVKELQQVMKKEAS